MPAQPPTRGGGPPSLSSSAASASNSRPTGSTPPGRDSSPVVGTPPAPRQVPRPGTPSPFDKLLAKPGDKPQQPVDGRRMSGNPEPPRPQGQTEPRDPVKPRGQPGPVRKSQIADKGDPGGKPKPEGEILFQQYFKSVGPRTYAAQVKRAANGNHFIVLTEGKRDDKTGEVRKTRLFVFSEDFKPFFDLVRDTVRFVKDNPLPPEVRKKRERFWAKQAAKGDKPGAGRRPPGPRAPTDQPKALPEARRPESAAPGTASGGGQPPRPSAAGNEHTGR